MAQAEGMQPTRRSQFLTRLTVAVGATGIAAMMPAGVAHAGGPGGPFRWCPGDSMLYSPTATFSGGDNGPGTLYSWDMNICHTWYRVRTHHGNVPTGGSVEFSDVWDGENPPAGEVLGPLPACGPSPLPCL